jgi:hypothetical protein
MISEQRKRQIEELGERLLEEERKQKEAWKHFGEMLWKGAVVGIIAFWMLVAIVNLAYYG